MKRLVFDPAESGKKMNIVCFVSGSGTNYREIVARDPDHNYLVFTNRPGCGGEEIARKYGHEVIELSHVPYLKEARKKYGPGNVPRNCPERIAYEQDAVKLIEKKLGKQPDLICLAGYDQWNTDWSIERYYPRMINVHPGDTTKGYVGLHWISSAKAILAGDRVLRSTLFFADRNEDAGPVLVQSAPLNIVQALTGLEGRGKTGLTDGLDRVVKMAQARGIKDYDAFKEQAGEELFKDLELVCSNLQDVLKVEGDWKIFPFAVHDLIARGRVAVDGRDVFVDDRKMPPYGYRLG
jgi:folate-dependent phosphoribosylglycinamide formyltransferase PurN